MTKGKLKHELFDDLELFLFFNDYRTLIEFSVEHNTPSILEKLMKYNPLIFDQIQSRYNLSRAIKPPISGNKLFKLIKSANKYQYGDIFGMGCWRKKPGLLSNG